MKNLTDLTIAQLEETKLLLNKMFQVLSSKSLDLPMTTELKAIQDLMGNIEDDCSIIIEEYEDWRAGE